LIETDPAILVPHKPISKFSNDDAQRNPLHFCDACAGTLAQVIDRCHEFQQEPIPSLKSPQSSSTQASSSNVSMSLAARRCVSGGLVTLLLIF
jgi:hypothetical protein